MTGWEINLFFFFLSATGSLSDVGKSIRVNVLYVVLKGAFLLLLLLLHILDLTAIPSSPRASEAHRR